MTDQELEEIKARLAEWETSKRIRATSKPNYAADHRYALAVDDLNTNAPTDIAALVARVEELEADVARYKPPARKDMPKRKPSVHLEGE